MNTCTCGTALETIEIAHRSATAMFCPACNTIWQPYLHEPLPPEPKPAIHPYGADWARHIRQQLEEEAT
jgi:hypothetical protein